MPYSEPSNLAIIACPGGEIFANKIITHLRHMYKHRFGLKRDVISKRYDVDKNTIVREINYYNDMEASELYVKGSVDKYRPAKFKTDIEFTRFLNGELKTQIKTCVRGKDVFIIQDIANEQVLSLHDGKIEKKLSVNDHLMALLVTIDAARRAGAASIALVLPTYPYSRQDKKKGREGLTASLLGNIYESMGVSRIITLDIHSREIENSFKRINIENLHASYQIIRELIKLVDMSGKEDELVIVAPDTGAVERNKFYATGLQKPLAMIYKERDYSVITQSAEETNIKTLTLLGDVKGKVAFLADDMLGSGGTLLKAMAFLKEQGAKKVIAAISLPFFNGKAIELFDEAYKNGHFYRIIGTNAVAHEELLKYEWYINTDVSGLFANIIMRVHHGQSLSDLLDNRGIIEKLVKVDQSTQSKVTE